MNYKKICGILLLLFIFLLLFIINRKKNVENFKSNEWTTNKDTLAAEKAPLNDTQKTEVKNMINAITHSELKTLIASQSPLLAGPAGPPGIQGPPGTKLVASGRLVNKKGSFDSASKEHNFFIPKFVVTRTEGTSPVSSLSFMDNVSPFASFQNWHLDIDNNIVNRYDNQCLTMNKTHDKIYLNKCDNDPNQKWTWDSSNRLISTSASTDNKLKCIGLSEPETNVLTTNIPGCKGEECITNTARKYLIVKNCDINNVNDDELWSFV